jgi:hypothetical protein
MNYSAGFRDASSKLGNFECLLPDRCWDARKTRTARESRAATSAAAPTFHRFHLGSAVAGAGAGTVGVQATWQSCAVSLLPRSYLREGGLRDGLSPRREDAGNRLSGAGSKRLDLCGRCQEACHRVGDAVSTRRCGCEGDYAFLCPSTRTCAGPGRAGLECFQGPASATRRSQTLARTPPRR